MSNNKIKDTVPPWYQDQLECQYRMLKEYLKAEPKIYLTIINIYQNDYPLLLHIPYKPSDVRWKNILKIIKEKILIMITEKLQVKTPTKEEYKEVVQCMLDNGNVWSRDKEMF